MINKVSANIDERGAKAVHRDEAQPHPGAARGEGAGWAAQTTELRCN